jgi:hypothetical protein
MNENAELSFFCPTKSTKLPNGVMHLTYRTNDHSGQDQLPFFITELFFGGGTIML